MAATAQALSEQVDDLADTHMSAEEIEKALLLERVSLLKEDARELALEEIADAVGEAIAGFDGSLSELQELTGLDKSRLSKFANGLEIATVASLARIALALGKSLKITIR